MSTNIKMEHASTNFADLERSAQALRAEYTRRAVARAVRGLRDAFARLNARFAEWSEKQRTLAELRELDDRMLADIGLTRGDIDLGYLPADRLAYKSKPRVTTIRPQLVPEFIVVPSALRAPANHNQEAPARAA